MTYDYVILSLFAIASVASLVQVALAIGKQRDGKGAITLYSLFQVPLFSFLAIDKGASVFEWELSPAIGYLYFFAFLILGFFGAKALFSKLNANAKFKAYRSDLFIAVFCIVAVIATYPF